MEAQPQILHCNYYARGVCRSCSLLELPYTAQLTQKEAQAAKLIPAQEWLPIAQSKIKNFRNKVKLVVSGTRSAPKLGIAEQDLRHCPLPLPQIRNAIPVLAEFIQRCQLTPYKVATNTGVLKFVLLTQSPRGELLVRFVVRRRGVQGAIFKHYHWLAAQLPTMRVCSINVQPERKAILEGAEEIIVSPENTLLMPLRLQLPLSLPLSLQLPQHTENFAQTTAQDNLQLPLTLQPKSFFQTNTEMAQVLYSRAASWILQALQGREQSWQIWDLYCGVGGFALAAAVALKNSSLQSAQLFREGKITIKGIETAAAAVAAANQAAQTAQLPAKFFAADSYEWARKQFAKGARPQIVIVNPPRRGIGSELAKLLNESQVEQIIYSSCNVESLAKDLQNLTAYQVRQAQIVDIFPHTTHVEALVLMTRTN